MVSIQTIQKVMSQISQTLQHATDVIALDVVLKVPNIPEMIADNMTTADICIQDARRLFAIIKIIWTGVLESKCSFHDGRETILNHITQWTFHTTSILADSEPILLNPLDTHKILLPAAEPKASTSKKVGPDNVSVDAMKNTKMVLNLGDMKDRAPQESKTITDPKPKPKRKYTKKASHEDKKKIIKTTEAKKTLKVQSTQKDENPVTVVKAKRVGRKKKVVATEDSSAKKMKVAVH